MRASSTSTCSSGACGCGGCGVYARRPKATRARANWKLRCAAMVGLALATGCASDEKGVEETADTGDCASTYGDIEITVVLADDYSDAIMDAFDGAMHMLILRLTDEPDTFDPSLRCTLTPYELVTSLDHDLTFREDFHVSAGWLCVLSSGRTTPAGLTDTMVCAGAIEPIPVPACSHVRAEMVVTCRETEFEGD